VWGPGLDRGLSSRQKPRFGLRRRKEGPTPAPHRRVPRENKIEAGGSHDFKMDRAPSLRLAIGPPLRHPDSGCDAGSKDEAFVAKGGEVIGHEREGGASKIRVAEVGGGNCMWWRETGTGSFGDSSRTQPMQSAIEEKIYSKGWA